MLDFLFSLFKRPLGLGNMSVILGHVADIVELFDEQYMNDKDAKNAAIKTVVKLLEDHMDPEIKEKK